MANSGVGMVTRWPTGYVGAKTSQPTVGWWADGVANSGVGVVTRQPTGYVGAMTSRPTVGLEW